MWSMSHWFKKILRKQFGYQKDDGNPPSAIVDDPRVFFSLPDILSSKCSSLN